MICGRVSWTCVRSDQARSPVAVGLLPTSGRLSDAGVFELSSTLDTVGPIAATVGDLALTLAGAVRHRRPAGVPDARTVVRVVASRDRAQ